MVFTWPIKFPHVDSRRQAGGICCCFVILLLQPRVLYCMGGPQLVAAVVRWGFLPIYSLILNTYSLSFLLPLFRSFYLFSLHDLLCLYLYTIGRIPISSLCWGKNAREILHSKKREDQKVQFFNGLNVNKRQLGVSIRQRFVFVNVRKISSCPSTGRTVSTHRRFSGWKSSPYKRKNQPYDWNRIFLREGRLRRSVEGWRGRRWRIGFVCDKADQYMGLRSRR